jgi:hypothetical protein
VGVGQQVLGHSEVMQVGWGEVAVSDHSRPADPQVGSDAVVGLLGALITTKGGQPGQPPAAVGTAEAADRHREAVQDRDGRVEADLAEQLLAELGLDRPQVGRLTHKGGAVDTGRMSRAPLDFGGASMTILRSGTDS